MLHVIGIFNDMKVHEQELHDYDNDDKEEDALERPHIRGERTKLTSALQLSLLRGAHHHDTTPHKFLRVQYAK